MKIAYIGSRKAGPESIAKINAYLDKLRADDDTEIEIVTGGAFGADTAGMKYAQENDLKLTVYCPGGTHNSRYCSWLEKNMMKAQIFHTGLPFLKRNTLNCQGCRSGCGYRLWKRDYRCNYQSFEHEKEGGLCRMLYQGELL